MCVCANVRESTGHLPDRGRALGPKNKKRDYVYPSIDRSIYVEEDLRILEQVILPVDNVAPKIKNILHCEVRGRDLGAEFSELTRVKDTSADIAEESKVSIVKLQASLIQKLQVKKLAYGDPMTDK
jgi:hypothetical protein